MPICGRNVLTNMYIIQQMHEHCLHLMCKCNYKHVHYTTNACTLFTFDV
jgi:hypothetical protein